MKRKLGKIVLTPNVQRRIGDFVCNFTAVVLGIIITFIGSDWIEENKTQQELKEALSLVKNEMLLNREYIAQMMERETLEQNGALYLLQYKDSLAKASPDSLEKYSNLPFQTLGFIYISDAMEMLKTSSLISAIQNKELATQIIKTYNTIKGSYDTFDSFMEIKQQQGNKLLDKTEVQNFINGEEIHSKAEMWSFLLQYPEGIQLIRQIAITHDNPTRMYGRYLQQIDETVAAIDEAYR